MLVAATVSAPAHAERWKELRAKPGVTYRIDLDSVQWQGRIVRYRADIVTQVQGHRRHGTVTALIDCDAGKRKLLESVQYLPDGSVRRETYPDLTWQPVIFLSEAPHHFLCLNQQ